MAMKLEVEKVISEGQIKKVLGAEDLSKSAKIKELFNGGLDVKQIAERMEIRYNFAYNVLSNYVNVNGIEVVKQERSNKKAQVIELLVAGKTKADISKELGINYNYIFQIEKAWKNTKGTSKVESKEA